MLKQPDINRLLRAQYSSGAKFLSNKTKALKYLEKKKDSFLSATLKNVGVLCLSKNSKNILMWSHYAQNHTGFVLEFKISLIPKTNINQVDMKELVKMLYPFSVTYSDKRPSLDFDNINSSLQTGLLTKHTGWAYEEEERVIDLVHGPGIHKFNPALINSVILGMKMSPDNKIIVLGKIKEFNQKHNVNIDVFSIKPAKNEFNLIMEQYW